MATGGRARAARRQGLPVTVHGTHHRTPDGFPVGDFVHVTDAADAHLAAVLRLDAGWHGTAGYEVGTGRGTSVLEVPAPSWSVADLSRTARDLRCRLGRTLDDALRSARQRVGRQPEATHDTEDRRGAAGATAVASCRGGASRTGRGGRVHQELADGTWR